MYFVYFLRSESEPENTYIGMTANLERRLSEHNSEDNTGYTSRHQPWGLEVFVMAETREVAETAEAYFKNSSGKEKFRNYATANPDCTLPVRGFIHSLEEGRGFGSGENRFKVGKNSVLVK